MWLLHNSCCGLQSAVQGLSVFIRSPSVNPEELLVHHKAGPDRALRGTAVKTSGPCFRPVLTVGEPQHLFPLHRFIPEDGW